MTKNTEWKRHIDCTLNTATLQFLDPNLGWMCTRSNFFASRKQSGTEIFAVRLDAKENWKHKQDLRINKDLNDQMSHLQAFYQ